MNALFTQNALWYCAIPLAALLLSAPFANAASNLPTSSQRSSSAVSATPQKFVYRLSAQETAKILANHSPSARMEEQSEPEEIVVSGEMSRLPMHASASEISPGLAALFWAVENPTQAWRIVLPVPAA